MQTVPRFMMHDNAQVEVIRTGHFPSSVIVYDTAVKKQYEVDWDKLKPLSSPQQQVELK